MKKLFGFLFFVCVIASLREAHPATLRYDVITITNNPFTSNSFTVQGIQFIWTNNTPASATFIQTTNGPGPATTNLWLALNAYGFTTIDSLSVTNTNALLIAASPNQALTSAQGGITNWAVITKYTNTSAAGYNLALPLISNNTTQKMTNAHTDLVDALNWKPGTNKIDRTAPAFTNFPHAGRPNQPKLTNQPLENPSLLGGSNNGFSLAYSVWTNGNLTWTSTVPIEIVVTTNTHFFNTNSATSRKMFFRDSLTDISLFSGNDDNIIASLADIGTYLPLHNDSQFIYDPFGENMVVIIKGYFTTNGNFYGTFTNWGVFQFASGATLQSADTTASWNFKSRAEGKDSSTALTPAEFPASQFTFDGTNLVIKSGASLSNILFWGTITVSGYFNGGGYSNITFAATSGAVGNLIATNANLYVLVSTNATLTNVTAALANLYQTSLRGPTTNYGAIVHVPAYITTMSSGANSLTRSTNNLFFLSGSSSANIDSITTNLGGGDWFDAWNVSGGAISIKHESSATAEGLNNPGTRINTYDGAQLNWPHNGLARFTYEAGSLNRWRAAVLYPAESTSTNSPLLTNGLAVGNGKLNLIAGSGVTLLSTNRGSTNDVLVSVTDTNIYTGTGANVRSNAPSIYNLTLLGNTAVGSGFTPGTVLEFANGTSDQQPLITRPNGTSYANWGVRTSGNAAWWQLGLQNGNNHLHFLNALNTAEVYIDQSGALYIKSLGTYTDNAINVINTSGGYSTTAHWFPADGVIGTAARGIAVGAGPASAYLYGNRAMLGLNPANGSGGPPGFVIAQEENVGGAGYIPHARMVVWEDRSVGIYNYSATLGTGSVAQVWWPNGNTTIGTSTNTTTNAGNAVVLGTITAPNLPTNASPVAFLATDADGNFAETAIPSGSTNFVPLTNGTGFNLSARSFPGATNAPMVFRNTNGNAFSQISSNGNFDLFANITYDWGTALMMVRTNYAQDFYGTNGTFFGKLFGCNGPGTDVNRPYIDLNSGCAVTLGAFGGALTVGSTTVQIGSGGASPIVFGNTTASDSYLFNRTVGISTNADTVSKFSVRSGTNAFAQRWFSQNGVLIASLETNGTLNVSNGAWFSADLRIGGQANMNSGYATGDFSALTFTDRSRTPRDKDEAWRALKSIQPSADGKLDHAKLDPSLWGSSVSNAPTGRFLTNITAAVTNDVLFTVPLSTNLVAVVTPAITNLVRRGDSSVFKITPAKTNLVEEVITSSYLEEVITAASTNISAETELVKVPDQSQRDLSQLASAQAIALADLNDTVNLILGALAAAGLGLGGAGGKKLLDARNEKKADAAAKPEGGV